MPVRVPVLGHGHVLDLPAQPVDQDDDLVAARDALAERGLWRILSEGGPGTLGELAVSGVADELCLSVTPFLVGPGPMRIIAGPALPVPLDLSLTGALEEDGALFLRYRLPG